MNHINKYFPYYLSIASIVIYGFYFLFQPQSQYQFCPKCDANQYQAIIDFFRGVNHEQIFYPYNNRILIPLIVSVFSFFSESIIFHIINAISVVVFVFFFSKVLVELKINNIVIIISIGWIVFHFSGIIRPVILDYKTIDAPTLCFHAILVYVLYKEKYSYLIWLAPMGTLLKESYLAYTLVIFVYTIVLFIINDKNKLPFIPIILAVLLSLFLKLSVNKLVLPINTHHNEIRTLFLHVYLAYKEPLRVLAYIVSFYLVYGLYVWVAFANIFKTKLKSHFELILFLLALVSIAFGILGGGDTTRIMMLGFPFIFLAIILVLKSLPIYSWILLLILSIIVLRLESSIPDFSINREEYSSWYVEKMNGDYILFWLTAWILAYILYSIINPMLDKKFSVR